MFANCQAKLAARTARALPSIVIFLLVYAHLSGDSRASLRIRHVVPLFFPPPFQPPTTTSPAIIYGYAVN